MSDKATVITGDGIMWFHAVSQLSALYLECKGMRHSRGSVYAHVKKTYGLKGNKKSVFQQFRKMLLDNGWLDPEGRMAKVEV